MANVVTDDTHYKEIADAIRQGADAQQRYLPVQMADAIRAACQKQFADGMAQGHRVESGTFTLAQDTNILSLDIPPNAQLIEITPVGTPSATTGMSRMPVHYLMASQQFQEHNDAYKNLGAMVQYFYNSRYYTSYYAYDAKEGLSVELASGLVFEGNAPYRWVAHYW